jgi:4-amino-4-deoxy-L-arabinose transferase-like glycosyltransferase
MDTRQFRVVVAVVALVALAVRVIGIDRATLWYDEVLTAQAVAMPALDLIPERLRNTQSPMFYLLLHVLGVPTDSIFLVRLPAALFGVATVVAGMFAARALAEPRAGWMAGLLFAFTPILVDYSQEARPYTALTFGVVLALCGAARVVRHPRLAAAVVQRRPQAGSRRGSASLRGAWLLLIGGSVWAFFMLPVGVLLWPALDCAIACLALAPHSRWRRLVRPWIAHRIICVMISLPLALALSSAIYAHAGHYWFRTPTAATFWQTTAKALFFQFAGDPGTVVGDRTRAILVVLVVVVALFGVLSIHRRHGVAAIALTASFLPLLVLGLVTIHTPVWVDRYLLIATSAFTLILAIGLAAAWPWHLGRAIAAGIFVLVLLQLRDLQNGSRRADWRPLVATVSSAPHEIFLVAAHNHQLPEIHFEWRRQHLAGEPSFVTFGIGGHPRPDASYWLLGDPSYASQLRRLAGSLDRRDWQRWIDQMGYRIDLSRGGIVTPRDAVSLQHNGPR